MLALGERESALVALGELRARLSPNAAVLGELLELTAPEREVMVRPNPLSYQGSRPIVVGRITAMPSRLTARLAENSRQS
jgi:hypothetical protein